MSFSFFRRCCIGAMFLSTIGLVCALLPAGAQTGPADNDLATAKRIIAYERDGSDVMTNLEYLSDRIGPRLTGSERLKKANDWTAERMRAYGLENVHLEAYTIPRGWERGAVEARIVEPNSFPVHAAQMAWTPGTRGKISGPVIVFAPKTEADFAVFKGKLRNAILLMSESSRNPSLPGATPPPPIPAFALPQSPSEKTPVPPAGEPAPIFRQDRAFRNKIAEFLQKEGAAVVLRDAGKPHDLLNMTGSWTSPAAFPTLFVAHEQVALLQRLLKRNLPVKMEIKVDCRFTRGPVTVYNTVGELRGAEKPEEVVLLGAHLDSWDLGQGTTDNGTGSMVVLEAARLLKSLGAPLKRTVRFALFTGEEEGLMGSKAYVDAHKAEMAKFNVVFVHDTGTGRVKGLWLQNRAETKPLLEKQFAFLNALGLLTDAPQFGPGKMNGTDHASFDDAGVPAFAFTQDSAEYGLTHHSESDTFDKARPDDLKQGACVLAILAYNAAQMPEPYPRSKTPERATAR